jgi:drug/metabolite transporter (DMT)-like permease
MTPFTRLVAACALTMVAFAANSILTRLALTASDTGPATFSVLRLAAGAGMLCALVLLRRGDTAGGARLRAGLRWRNAGALALYVLGFSFAYVTLDAGLGALILFGVVQITMFAGGLWMREPIPPRRWAGAGLAFAGLAWLMWPAGAYAPPVAGAALMAAAAVGWAVFSLLGKGSDDPLAITAGSFALALIPALAVLAVVGLDGADATGVVLALVSGALTSGLGYALWYRLLPQLASSVAGVLQLTVPVIAMAGGMVFLGEALTARFAIAAALVMGGVALAVIAPSVPARRA